jgi:hypothetical protein
MLPIGAPVLLLSRRADPPTPPQSSSPLRQTSVRTQARTQASQTQPHLSPLQDVSGPTQRLHIRLPASNAASTRVQPSQRLQTRPQLSQSAPMRPQNVREPLAPLNGTQGHAIASQSSPVRPAAPRRSQVSPYLLRVHLSVQTSLGSNCPLADYAKASHAFSRCHRWRRRNRAG